MLYMDTRLEVYPGYQRHRAAMHTVAHFLNMEIWRVAETLSCRIKSYRQPRIYLIVPGNLADNKLPNNSSQKATPAKQLYKAMNSTAACTTTNSIAPGNKWQ